MLAQKLAVVTGAARGIGFAVARDLAAAGCMVLMVGRGAEAIEDAARQLRESGHEVLPHIADVTDAGAVAALGARLRREFGRADILVNNAGVFLEAADFVVPQAASVFVVDPELVAATHACNALAPLRLIQVLVPLMRENRWGRIVNVSSGMGQLAQMGGFWPGYRMSKAALNALTRLTAKELEGTPIKINSVCPGWCRTGMGGENATRSAEEGAKGIVWAALLPDDGPSGGFFRDGQVIEW
ncbi:MAG: SDR family oxidoreductase [Candidatus Accumulibacter phosphatis]|jgi:NAD(P)-dependent dehydrogenase (short-subunit alcohol dehydrogenase family)|uniref:SDR family oxidoreductase n=1 Tax=Candidatus Accumulibacter contiguus TaxID=2954381 RepID=A0ABX1T2J3_9PROT|nr:MULTISPECIES: SDR family oxidoreductase [Candidatus Accumulibacter]MBL8407029.1 SDR family oxidoreductase [Accumulibacter sp.]NMQ03848.1 SDR family oxidoreductase [Candidatus Accumulibacter contiguus]HRF11007.1 SDR family oxidoreductase [Candidatus Accumulibacter phosphatis]